MDLISVHVNPYEEEKDVYEVVLFIRCPGADMTEALVAVTDLVGQAITDAQ